MSKQDNMAAFKDQICGEHLVPIEDRLRKVYPGQEPKITLLIRTPWLADGGVLITNDSIDEAKAELERLGKKEAVR